MGDHGHHDPGGHELQAINTKMLFRLLLALTPLTLLACAAVVQWFNWQVRELDARYAVEGSVFLDDYQASMDADLQGVDQVAQGMAAKPEMLTAPPPPSGWVHPDDLAGAAPAAADDHADDHAEEPVPVPKPDAPAEGDVPAEGDTPAEGDAPEQPAAPAEGQPAAPADDKPDKPAKPAKPATPADDKPDKGNNGKADEKADAKADQ